MAIFDPDVSERENDCIFSYIGSKHDGAVSLKDLKNLLNEFNI